MVCLHQQKKLLWCHYAEEINDNRDIFVSYWIYYHSERDKQLVLKHDERVWIWNVPFAVTDALGILIYSVKVSKDVFLKLQKTVYSNYYTEM